jgi:phage-related protein
MCVGHGGICGEGLGEKIGGGAEVTLVDLLAALRSKKMVAADDLWEVRVIFAGNIFRLLGWRDGTDKLVLAHGFTKKTEKTPLQEIRTTETRKKIYENKET